MVFIPKQMIEANLEAAERAIEETRAQANAAIGNAIGRRDLLKQQLEYILEQEKLQANAAEEDVVDAHPLKLAKAVAEAAAS